MPIAVDDSFLRRFPRTPGIDIDPIAFESDYDRQRAKDEGTQRPYTPVRPYGTIALSGLDTAWANVLTTTGPSFVRLGDLPGVTEDPRNMSDEVWNSRYFQAMWSAGRLVSIQGFRRQDAELPPADPVIWIPHGKRADSGGSAMNARFLYRSGDRNEMPGYSGFQVEAPHVGQVVMGRMELFEQDAVRTVAIPLPTTELASPVYRMPEQLQVQLPVAAPQLSAAA